MPVDRSPPSVAIVIPYYQRVPGILRACLASVLHQEGDFDLRIYVIDDGSPISAAEELSDLSPRSVASVTVIRQQNSGPGAARNRALNAIPVTTTYIALLDSDDSWERGFLSTALKSLETDADVFFSNTRRFSQPESRFDWTDSSGAALNLSEHRFVDAPTAHYRFSGDFFDFALKRSNIISTSSLVYRRSIAPDLRFDDSLYNGQDRLFKLELVRKTNRISFSSDTLCTEGEGVNIFDSAVWGSSKAVKRAASYVMLNRRILQKLQLTNEQRYAVTQTLFQHRKDLVAALLSSLRKRKAPVSEILEVLRHTDIATLAMTPFLVAYLAIQRYGQRS